MELEEKISEHFNVPFVYSESNHIFACNNGVWFKEKEYEAHRRDEKWLQKQYAARLRSKKFPLCDYALLKTKDILKHKEDQSVNSLPPTEETKRVLSMSMSAKEMEDLISGWKCTPESNTTVIKENLTTEKEAKSVLLISFALGLVSIVSMYISTVHTATYLFDYVDVVSAWLMSAVITIYSSTAFEVVILFHERKRHFLSVIFAFLWAMVITFSMVTTVSVFYDRFNFTTLENAEENKEEDGSRLALDILKSEEASIREAIEFKKEDIEYRRKMDYATNTRTLELNDLQADLQENLNKQKDILKEIPNASKKVEDVHRKETLFAFLGRVMNIEGGILEFIMSTLSAIFVNLISPLSLTVVVSFTGGKRDENNHNSRRSRNQN